MTPNPGSSPSPPASSSAAATRPSTATHDRLALRRYILPALGSKPLDAVTTMDVQRLQAG